MIEQLPVPPLRFPVFACGLQKGQGSKDIGLCKRERIQDGPVHVALGGKMDYSGDVVVGDHFPDCLVIANVGLDERIIGLAFYVLQICEVARICELVEVYYPVAGIFLHEQPDHVVTYETGPSGHQDGSFPLHRHPFNLPSCNAS